MSSLHASEIAARTDVPLRQLTWYRLGGPARWLCEPAGTAALSALLRTLRHHEIAWRVLGKGANLLVREQGVDDAVIRLVGAEWEQIRWPAEAAPPPNSNTRFVAGESGQPSTNRNPQSAHDPSRFIADSNNPTAPECHAAPADKYVWAAAGVDFPRLVKAAAARGLCGLENLAGIPGSLGGIIRMNAGGKYGSIAQYVRDVTIVDAGGGMHTLPAAAVGFGYRSTQLGDCVVAGATLALRPGDPETALADFRRIWNEKYATQPAVSERSAGCIFKNPPNGLIRPGSSGWVHSGEQPDARSRPDGAEKGVSRAPAGPSSAPATLALKARASSGSAAPMSAGALIDRAGLKGARIGGAEISRRHANFIVARDGATADDVLQLIELAREGVLRAFGVELELEVEVW